MLWQIIYSNKEPRSLIRRYKIHKPITLFYLDRKTISLGLMSSLIYCILFKGESLLSGWLWEEMLCQIIVGVWG